MSNKRRIDGETIWLIVAIIMITAGLVGSGVEAYTRTNNPVDLFCAIVYGIVGVVVLIAVVSYARQ